MESIVQTDDWDVCFICGRNRNAGLQTHHIFGGPNRRLSDEDGLTVRLCVDCHRKAHRDRLTADYLHYQGRMAYLEHHTQEEFRQRYGREE